VNIQPNISGRIGAGRPEVNYLYIFKRILIIQTAFIGDVILTTPLIECLAEAFPDAVIDFLTIPKSKELIVSNPNIRKLIVFDKRNRDRGLKGLYRVSKLLKSQNYDLCITPHRSLRSAYLSWNTKANCRVGFSKSAWKGAFTHIVKYEQNFHEIERNLSLLSAIGLRKQLSVPVLYSADADKQTVERYLSEEKINGKMLFAVAPGSVWPTKRWPQSYYSEFCEIISDKGIRIVLIGGPEDQDLCNIIAKKSDTFINSAGQLNLRETYHLLTKCIGILTNDSAPLHLGMAANINVFAIFGSTVPEFGFAPFGSKSKIFENRELKCRPCAIHGGKKCPIKTFDCMKSLHPKPLAHQVLQVISK
jgi:heptosyltransferase-2